MKAEIKFQPNPEADYVFSVIECSDELPFEKLVEAVSLTMRNAASPNRVGGLCVIRDGKMEPLRA